MKEVLDIWREESLAFQLNELGTKWEFIPPAAPHHGGLWERSVRSMKHHLQRAVGTEKFTFNQLATLLTVIEACLNSRPLMTLSTVWL